jgi:hypothetical protein
MDNIINKIKKYFLSNFGKLSIGISVLSFIITLMLSIALKNRIDISIFKGLLSSLITMIILYALNIALTKYLGDIIEMSNIETITSVPEDSLNPENSSAENDNLKTSNDSLNEIASESNNDSIFNDITNNQENIIKEDFKNISKENINIDKNNKANYHSPRGDIGDIILNTPAYQSSSDISDSSVYYDSGRKVNERIIEKEVMEDPERTASAIRTMIAKDKDKKES